MARSGAQRAGRFVVLPKVRRTIAAGVVCTAIAAPAVAIGDDKLATWTGGEALASEVDRALSQVSTRGRTGGDSGNGLDKAVERYRRAARGVAVEKIVLASIEDRQQAIEDSDDADGYRFARQQALLDAYLATLRDAIEISDEQVEAYYEENRDQFQVPKSVTLWNIYRRDDGDRDETLEALAELRRRIVDGNEAFSAVAREHSESETRLRDGRVGHYREGELPEELGKVVFALEDGAVSEPLPVSDGAVLLHVSDVVEASTFSVDEVEERIRRRLTAARLEETIVEKAGEEKPPAGSTVLALDELKALYDGDDHDAVALEIGNFRLTAIQAARQSSGVPRPLDFEADEDADTARDEAIEYGYAGLVRRALLYSMIEADKTLIDADRLKEAEEHLVDVRDRALVDSEVRRRVRERAAADEGALERFFDDNAHHFQSEPRFRVRELTIATGEDPLASMRKLEAARDRVVAGSSTLEDEAAELGGEIAEFDPKTVAELTEVGPKVPGVVLELGAAGLAVPFQEDDLLHLIDVVERQEPRQLSFAEAREAALDEYLERHQRSLSDEVTDELLSQAGYEFDEQAVRTYLVPPL